MEYIWDFGPAEDALSLKKFNIFFLTIFGIELILIVIKRM